MKKKSAAVFTLTKRFMILTTNGSRSRIRRTLFDTTHYELKLGNIDFCPQKKFKKQQKMNIFGHKITQDFFLTEITLFFHVIVHCEIRRTLFDLHHIVLMIRLSHSRKLSSKNCLLAIPDLKIHVYETLFCCKNFTV